MTEAVLQGETWHRLDKRMLLVHPLHEVFRQAPLLIGSIVIGSQTDSAYGLLIGPVVIVGIALLRWFTTTFRIGLENVDQRTGLLRRRLISVPRSRIRSVDVEATVVHRILGLSVVKIRTAGNDGGGGHGMFQLEGIATPQVEALRAELLRDVGSAPESQGAPAPGRELARLSPHWTAYAPLSSTGHILSTGIVGTVFPLVSAQGLLSSADTVGRLGLLITVAAAIVAYSLLTVTVACAHYSLTYGGLKVVEDRDGRLLHVSYGLLKTQHSSLDRTRLRGVTLRAPLLLRLAGGARLDAIMTGVSAGFLLLPAAPAKEPHRLAHAVLGSPDPMSTHLISHGPAASRRRYVRALLPLAAVALALAVLGTPAWSWVLLVLAAIGAVGLAEDRYRGLGHAVLPGWLVTQSGSLDRRRDVLSAEGVIAWTVRQTWFQRRAGLATVIAATPAGKHGYRVIDLPAHDAWSLVESVTPGAGDVWTHRSSSLAR